MIDAVAEKKFLLLKKRLDALHYCQPFTIDSAALIERLLNDLIKTTEGFQSLKKTNEELKINLAKSEQRLEPLKKENGRLVKENNELHYEMIRLKEDIDLKESTWNNRFKSLEGDKADLKQVMQLKDTKYLKLEEEFIALRRKLDLVIKKQYVGGAKGLENIPPEVNGVPVGKTGRFEITKALKPNEIEEELLEGTKKGQADEYKQWAENLRKADEKVNSLKEELKNAAMSRATLEEKIKHIEIQVSNRDKEIKRLQAKLDVGEGSLEKISTDYSIKTSGDKIEKLNSQIDLLTKENFSLEDTVKDLKKELSRSEHLRTQNAQLETTIRELTQKNDELRSTLKNNERIIDRMRDTRAMAESEVAANKNEEIKGLKSQVEKLSNRVEDLVAENATLKFNSTRADQAISAYNSDKLAFSEVVQELKEDQAAAEARVERLQVELNKQIRENEQLKDNLSIAQGKVQSLQREIELLRLNMSKNFEGQQSNDEIITALRGRLAELEAENLSLVSNRAEFEIQLERANRLKEHAEEQWERLKNEVFASKSTADTSNVAKQRFQTLYEEAQKDISQLKRENKSLEVKLVEEKRTSNELDMKCNEYFNNLKSAQEHAKDLEKEIGLLNDQLALRLQELRKSETLRQDIEREFAMLKGSNNKLDDQVEKNKRLREDMKRLEGERVSALKRVDELTLEARELNEKITRKEEEIRRERQAKEELSEKIDMLAAESDNFDLNLKRVREREQEHNRILAELEGVKKRERELIEENERMRRELRKQETLISQGSKQVEHINQQKDELLNEIKQLRDEISILKTSDNDVKTRSIKLQEKVNNLEIMVADLKDERSKDEKQITGLEEEVRRGKMELEKERRKAGDLNEQVNQLKTLAESLEKTREDLLVRLQNKNNERSMEEGERMRLQDEIKRLKERVRELEGEVMEMKNAVTQIDSERDTLQEQLDEKTELFEDVKKRYESQEEELRRLREKSSAFMATSDVNIGRIHELEAQLKEINRRNVIVTEESNELKRILNVKQEEIQNLVNDLNIITRENQNLNQKIMILVEEKERVKDALGNVNSQEKMMRQSLRATELEREDILNNYRAVCVENDRLNRNCEELTAENQEFFRQIKEMEREINYLKSELHQFEIKEGQYMNELASYERNINMLNRRLEQADSMIRESHEAKERIIREFNQIRQANEGFEYSHDDLHKNLIRSEQERALLQDEIRELRNEFEMQKQQVEFERRKAQELEGMLAEQRKIQYRQNMDLEQLENEKMELQMTLERYEKKMQCIVGNTSRDMDLYRSGEHMIGSESGRAQRTVVNLERQFRDKESDMQNLISEQQGLREENSRLKYNALKSETEREREREREDLTGKLKLQESMESTVRSNSDRFYEQNSSKGQSEVWDKLRIDSETFKKNLDEVSLSSQYLKEKVRSLQNEYKDFLPSANTKKFS